MKRYLLLAAAAALFINGCAQESGRPKATGEGIIRAINTISTSPDFGFLVEERLLGQAGFRAATSPSAWDDLEYTFNFTVLLAGDTTRTRVASVPVDIEKDRDYTFLLSGAIDAPDVTIWEADVRDWQDSDQTYEMRFANTSAALGPVDVYFDPVGTAPAIGNRLGTLNFGEILPAQEFPIGERVLTLTAVDDPGTVFHQSIPLTLTERTSYILSPFDATANDVSPVPVVLINASLGGSSLVADADSAPTARFFHASRDMGDADIYIDDPLTTPIVAGHSFGDFTSDIPVVAGEVPVTYTSAGNMGSILIDVDRIYTNERRYNVFAIRNPDGGDVVRDFVIDRRSVETQAKLTLINTSVDHSIVDVYLLTDGETPEEGLPVIPSLTTLTPPVTLPLPQNSYDLYLTVQSEKTVLVGPVPLTLEVGDVVEGVVYDTVDPNLPRLEFIPLP